MNADDHNANEHAPGDTCMFSSRLYQEICLSPWTDELEDE
jgi:hypothetical protein